MLNGAAGGDLNAGESGQPPRRNNRNLGLNA